MAKSKKSPNNGKPWTQKEESMLLLERSNIMLSKKLGRSTDAISVKKSQLKGSTSTFVPPVVKMAAKTPTTKQVEHLEEKLNTIENIDKLVDSVMDDMMLVVINGNKILIDKDNVQTIDYSDNVLTVDFGVIPKV